jgi:membrane protease YdiL (CAAX protease family)
MAVGSKSFPQDVASQDVRSQGPVPSSSTPAAVTPRRARWVWGIGPVLQVGLGYALILAALWTVSRDRQAVWMCAATSVILLFTWRSGYSAKELGFGVPSKSGLGWMLGVGLIAAALLPLTALALGQTVPVNPNWPPPRGLAEYAIWAMLQQFILQSFFYVRMESVLGGKRAVLGTALLFASAHLPSPILTVATFVSALFFCEMFRRHRSVYPLGIVHAALGLAMALSVSNHLLHHMRVGIGFLDYR